MQSLQPWQIMFGPASKHLQRNRLKLLPSTFHQIHKSSKAKASKQIWTLLDKRSQNKFSRNFPFWSHLYGPITCMQQYRVNALDHVCWLIDGLYGYVIPWLGLLFFTYQKFHVSMARFVPSQFIVIYSVPQSSTLTPFPLSMCIHCELWDITGQVMLEKN